MVLELNRARVIACIANSHPVTRSTAQLQPGRRVTQSELGTVERPSFESATGRAPARHDNIQKSIHTLARTHLSKARVIPTREGRWFVPDRRTASSRVF